MTQLHPTSMLRVHTARKTLPAATNPATAASIAEVGVQQPLLVTEADGENSSPGYLYIVDGVDRYQGAEAVNIGEVPVIVIPQDMVQATLLHSLLARKHFTKFQLAYLAFPLLEPAVEEARERRTNYFLNAEKSHKSLKTPIAHSVGYGKNLDEIANGLGVGRTVFDLSKKVHDRFRAKPALRQRFEPDILAGTETYSTVWRSVVSFDLTAGKPREETREVQELWHSKLKGLRDPRKFSGWEDVAPEMRFFIANEVAMTISDQWPEELQEQIFKRLVARRRAAANA